MASFLIPLEIIIPIGLVIIILVVIAWFIISKNKRLYENIKSKKEKFSKYEQQISYLKQIRTPKQKELKNLNQNSRNFFKEYFNLSYSLTYLELEKYFKKQERQDYAKFCKLMSDANYQGNQIPSEQIKQLIELFGKIIKEYK